MWRKLKGVKKLNMMLWTKEIQEQIWIKVIEIYQSERVTKTFPQLYDPVNHSENHYPQMESTLKHFLVSNNLKGNFWAFVIEIILWLILLVMNLYIKFMWAAFHLWNKLPHSQVLLLYTWVTLVRSPNLIGMFLNNLGRLR